MGKDWGASGLLPALQRAMTEDFGFPSMTPVQAAAIPLFSQNKDVCVEACTGSGKTLVYLLPIFHKLLLQPVLPTVLFAVIIAPSRELAHQIYEVAVRVKNAVRTEAEVYCMTGGTSIPQEIELLTTTPPQILIATPGRLGDMLEKVQDWNIHSLEILVLDEADRLLDMGFQDKIHSIVRSLPKQRRTGLFSATMSTGVKELISAGLRNPAFISVRTKSRVTDTKGEREGNTLPKGLTNYYVGVEESRGKVGTLVEFLKENRDKKVIVLSQLPSLSSHQILHIHGKMPQKKRERVYSAFESSQHSVLLTTDLIARGIDFPDIDWIVQFDPPKSPDSFVHRIGRTARAGKVGKTLLILRTHEEAYIPLLGKRGVALEEMTVEAGQHMEEVATIVQSAFVSYLRYYQEHELSYIFRMKDLDLGSLAHSFCLLRLPRVSEILGKSIPSFTPSNINPDSITFKDPVKEQKRAEEREK